MKPVKPQIQAAKEACERFWQSRSRPRAREPGRGYRRRARFNRSTWKYQVARSEALGRDAYCCTVPGCDMWGPGNVEVAHKIPVSERPDLAEDPNNMETLCLLHHDEKDGRKPRRYGKRRWFHNPWQQEFEYWDQKLKERIS